MAEPGNGISAAASAELGELLVAERARTEARVAALTRDFQTIVEAAAIGSTDDEHDPEGATIAFERAQILALREQAEAHLRALSDAERRLRQGEFGRCEGCGEAIPLVRLQARPTATRCVACS